MKITARDLFSIEHYEYGEAYFGSLNDLRFRVAREPLIDVHFIPQEQRGESVLRVSVWPEPDSYRSAPKESISFADFPFTQEGLEQAAEWLNEQ